MFDHDKTKCCCHYNLFEIILEAVVVQWHKRVTVNETALGSILSRIIINSYFHFFALVPGQSSALNFAIQHAMLRKFGGKW